MNKNYALPGNPNTNLTRNQAIEMLVDEALNGCETEWVGASIIMVIRKKKTMEDAKKDIREMAKIICVSFEEDMIDEAYNKLIENQMMFAG